MSDILIKVLLVENNPWDTLLIREMLAGVGSGSLPTGRRKFDLECVNRLSTGLERLAAGGIDIILLDLGLPDSQGLDTFATAHAQAPEVPVVVMTGLDDEAMAIEAVREGTQDYLVKGQVDSSLLVRSIRYAIERHRMQAALRSMALVDELTGLYNRRGFLTLSEQQLKLACRTKKGSLVFFADIDGLKQINDTYGHLEGDQALIQTAKILRETFRASDVIARIGGDEFTVFAIQASHDNAESIIARSQENLRDYNAQNNRHYELSLSLGVARFDPECAFSIEDMMAKADEALYDCKRSKLKTKLQVDSKKMAKDNTANESSETTVKLPSGS